MAADTTALARMLYALLTGYWPGDEPTALPPAPRHKGQVCTPRQVRAGVPAMLDAITYRALQGQAADAPLRPQTPAGMAMALRMVQRPSYQLERLESEPVIRPGGQQRHGRGTPGPGLASGSAPRCCARLSEPAGNVAEFLRAGQGVGQVIGQAVRGGQHLGDPGGHVAGQLARGVRLLASQVFHLVEEIFQLAGVGIPAVVRVAVGGFGGQPGEDVIEFGAQVGGRVGAGADPGEHRGDRVRAGPADTGCRAGAVCVQAERIDPDADLDAVHDRLDLRPDRGKPRYLARQRHGLREDGLVHGRAQ